MPPAQNRPPFIPGAELCRLFYEEAVRPIMEHRFNGIRYGAARLDNGSDALGFDTPVSMDHSWGPRLNLYIADADYSDALRADIRRVLADELPFEIHGFPTNFSPPADGRQMRPTAQRDHGPIGNTGHWIDSTDALSGGWRPAYLRQYQEALGTP